MALTSMMTRFRIPIFAVISAVIFLGYGLAVTGQRVTTCNRLAPEQVQCQSEQSLIWGLLPVTNTQFWLQDVAIDSTICDNIPRGGVRFCHQVTLVGSSDSTAGEGYSISQPLPEIRTPLSAKAVQDQFLRFIHGDGNKTLTFKATSKLATYVRAGVLGLLLAIVTWGLWDVQWPPEKVPPLAMDGAEGE